MYAIRSYYGSKRLRTRIKSDSHGSSKTKPETEGRVIGFKSAFIRVPPRPKKLLSFGGKKNSFFMSVRCNRPPNLPRLTSAGAERYKRDDTSVKFCKIPNCNRPTLFRQGAHMKSPGSVICSVLLLISVISRITSYNVCYTKLLRAKVNSPPRQPTRRVPPLRNRPKRISPASTSLISVWINLARGRAP